MFTVPDTNDAVATCPPLSPVGPLPQGFFADCNPGQNFPGTRPIAEHFNELILNLHALLTQAGVAALKGDPTMLWKSVLMLPIVQTSKTLQVVPSGGSAAPVNPWAGDPFNSLASALTFLARYRIAGGATVTINLAAGTYPQTAGVLIYHPDGYRIAIQGAGPTNTILSATNAAGGLVVVGDLSSLKELTIQGDGSVPATGAADGTTALWINVGAYCGIGNVTLKGFGGHGLIVDGGQAGIFQGCTATIQSNHIYGLSILNNGSVNAAQGSIVAQNNTVSQVAISKGGMLSFDTIQTLGGSGAGVICNTGLMIGRRLTVDACGAPSQAVLCQNGATMISSSVVQGDWSTWNTGANTAQSFYAEVYGLIRSGNALATNNRSNSSPAINVLGNTQAMILTT